MEPGMVQHAFRLQFQLMCLVALNALAATQPAYAQEFPSGTIRFVVPSAAGTPPDILSRIVANEIGRTEGWRIITENKPGAMQTIGAGEVLRHEADGHTIFVVAMSSSVAPALLPNVPFRLNKDFVPVLKLATVNHVLVVNPAVQAKSLPELISLLKGAPDKMTFSSGGFGTPAHLAGELFKLKADLRATHVPYQALPQAIGDLLNGTNQFQFITPLPVLDLIATGKLRALAVTSPTRMSSLKDVPTVIEEGHPELIIQDWIGLMVKRGTPDAIVSRLNAAANAALEKSAVRDAFIKIGADPVGGTSLDFGKYVSSQTAHWEGVVRSSGIKMQQ
jgi:tripartite-type tricarboxylate transporter receptor subunit TctC